MQATKRTKKQKYSAQKNKGKQPYTPKRDAAPKLGALQLYTTRHLQACLASLGHLVRTPLTSVITIIVIGIAMALPMCFYLLLQNAQSVGKGFDNSAQISLYLKKDVSENQAQQLVTRLQQRTDITAAHYISPAQGLQQFEQQSDFSHQVINSLNQNPLPGVIVIRPKSDLSSAFLQQLVSQLKQIPAVGLAQLDMQWIKRLYAIIAFGKHSIYALACLLGLGVLLITGNTIHLATQSYHKDIEVFKLVGATNAFVRRPFLYSGIFYGLFGSVSAWILVTLILWWLQAPLNRLVRLYGSGFQLQGLDLKTSAMLLVIGCLLGLFGARLAVSRHLKTNLDSH